MNIDQICYVILKDSGKYKVNKKQYKLKRNANYNISVVLPEEYWNKPVSEQHTISYSSSSVFSSRVEAQAKCDELNQRL